MPLPMSVDDLLLRTELETAQSKREWKAKWIHPYHETLLSNENASPVGKCNSTKESQNNYVESIIM